MMGSCAIRGIPFEEEEERVEGDVGEARFEDNMACPTPASAVGDVGPESEWAEEEEGVERWVRDCVLVGLISGSSVEDLLRWNLIDAVVGLAGLLLSFPPPPPNLELFEVEAGKTAAAIEGDAALASEGFMASNILIRSSYVSCCGRERG